MSSHDSPGLVKDFLVHVGSGNYSAAIKTLDALIRSGEHLPEKLAALLLNRGRCYQLLELNRKALKVRESRPWVAVLGERGPCSLRTRRCGRGGLRRVTSERRGVKEGSERRESRRGKEIRAGDRKERRSGRGEGR